MMSATLNTPFGRGPARALISVLEVHVPDM